MAYTYLPLFRRGLAFPSAQLYTKYNTNTAANYGVYYTGDRWFDGRKIYAYTFVVPFTSYPSATTVLLDWVNDGGAFISNLSKYVRAPSVRIISFTGGRLTDTGSFIPHSWCRLGATPGTSTTSWQGVWQTGDGNTTGSLRVQVGSSGNAEFNYLISVRFMEYRAQ